MHFYFKQQPTTPPPLSQTQVAEVQHILINAFKSNDRELFWKQCFQKLIVSLARQFDSDEDMAETVLVDSCAGRGPPVVETVAVVPHVLRTYVGNPPGLYSPGALGCSRWLLGAGSARGAAASRVITGAAQGATRGTSRVTEAVTTEGAREAGSRVTTWAAHGATRGAAATSRVRRGAAGAIRGAAGTNSVTEAVIAGAGQGATRGAAGTSRAAVTGDCWKQKYVAVRGP